jgi:hypothetical protein
MVIKGQTLNLGPVFFINDRLLTVEEIYYMIHGEDGLKPMLT